MNVTCVVARAIYRGRVVYLSLEVCSVLGLSHPDCSRLGVAVSDWLEMLTFREHFWPIRSELHSPLLTFDFDN